MKKIIAIESCQECPLVGECKAWKALTKSQRVQLAISNTTPTSFILAKCHLEDEVINEVV
tara:strand:- start:452 stop:631 length:180 start_codon:yes stop_codon:yes gene_type:complete